jgi:hypothetical protein
MKFRTLNNRDVRIEIIPSRYPMRSRSNSRSYGQYNLGKQIRSLYGQGAQILEEFPIPETRLSLDFFMPNHALAFEFQGLQHDEFNSHFHVDKDGFERQKIRDQRKREWCEINDIILVEVRDPNISVGDLMELVQEFRG